MNEADIDSSTKVTVYRVVQELLNNIIKHALASNVIVQVIAKDGSLHVTVEDNGKGFDTALLESVEGIGYKNIRSRIDYLKGRIDIQSQAGKGTSVYIEIPI
jgi:signal transduction histidine kinase